MEKDPATNRIPRPELSVAATELVFPMTELVEMDVRDEEYPLPERESRQ